MMQATEQGHQRPDGRFQLLGTPGRVGYEKLGGDSQVSIRAEVTSDLKSKLVQVPEKQGWRKLLAYFGPGFLVAIAYMDPGNFESDLQAGAKYKYELLWVLLLATTAGLLIQSLAANLGVVTGRHLSEHCRSEYGKQVNLVLWLLAEVAIVASDIPEVIGTAYALNLLFRLPLWLGVLLTGLSTLLFLALQQYGVRKLEVFIAFLVLVMASCFFVEVAYARPAASEIVRGLLVPSLRGQGATAIAISLIGAMVMPHNLYLHSALVLTRKTPRTVKGIRDGCRYNLIECSFALLVSFVVNIAVVAVSGAVCSKPGLSPQDLASCQDLDLNRASFLLRNVLGSWSSTVFALALLASGQSSTITGTYAGQYVMQGFLELRFAPWLRNMMTRCVAIVPSLAVALIGGESGAGKLIIVSSMILSFELPFALLPLLKFTSNSGKMGPHVNPARVTRLTWVVGCLIIAINVYFLGNAFIHWMIRSQIGRLRLALLGIAGFAALICYVAFILYLAIRQDRVQTCTAATEAEEQELPMHDVKGIGGWMDSGSPGPATTVPAPATTSPLSKDTYLEAPVTPLLAVPTTQFTDDTTTGVSIVPAGATVVAPSDGTVGGGLVEDRASGSAL